MPKDATKNVDRYKVRGGHLNEYEYNKNQHETTRDKKATDKNPMNTEKKKQSISRGAAKKK